jgi:Tol biopolymer transport system component
VELYNIATSQTRVLYQTAELIEAPNFSPCGTYLMFNGNGLMYKLPFSDEQEAKETSPIKINTSFAMKCNNDHGISPDGKWLAISDKMYRSCIYVLPVDGSSEPRQVTANLPSYFHGWSPDSSTVAYCGIRNDIFDIYTIPISGNEEEKRLTTGQGRNDGPDWSVDNWIYFNSSRTGVMQIFRIKPDGSELQQLTDDDYSNWFPHPTPDGKKILLISYDADVEDHPRDLNVRIRMMDADGSNLTKLFDLFGGQGSINVNNWRNCEEFAFVRYFPV